MKKSVLVFALALGVTGAFAQDLTSKKGEPMLPEAEDWAISLDAAPIFSFVGNAFNGNTANAAPGVAWLNGNQTIIGKKFIDEKNAYRVLVRLGFTNQTYKNMVADDANIVSENPRPKKKYYKKKNGGSTTNNSKTGEKK